MQIIKYLSETMCYGSSLGMSIFIYGLLISGIILAAAVSKNNRKAAALSYAIAITDILFFMTFYNMDMYRKISVMNGTRALDIFGSGVITCLINVICLMAIYGIIKILQRFMRDKKYSL